MFKTKKIGSIEVLSLCILYVVLIYQFKDHLHSNSFNKFIAIKESLASPNDQSANESNVTTLNDIHFTIKTTKNYLNTRIEILLKTWIKFVKSQVYIVTDIASVSWKKRLNKHIVISKCPRSHQRIDLCCKLGAEYDNYMASDKKWWCRFDDDAYVHIEGLLNLLNQYNPNVDFVYIGREPRHRETIIKYHQVSHNMRFLTGAGICISRILANDLKEWMGNGKFTHTCSDVRLPDDMTLGFVITKFLNKSLIASDLFHTHLEKLRFSLRKRDYQKQVMFSYKEDNVVQFKFKQPQFNTTVDPTRFLSLHCLYYPNDEICTDNS